MANKKICPKIDIQLGGFLSVKKYIKDRMEIHLLNMNIKNIEKQLKLLVGQVLSLKVLTLHLPGCCLDIETIAINKKKENEFNKLIDMCNRLSIETGVDFQILAHCGWNNKSLIPDDSLLKYLRGLSNKLKESNITLLLEPTIEVYKDNIKDYDRASYLINKLRNKNIRLCLDLSHLKAMCNRFNFTKEEYVNYFRYVKPIQTEQIHINSSINGDGYINLRKTHGVKHYNLAHLKEDFKLLELLKVEKAYLVPEVMEYSNVYKKRKCEVKEIQLINML